MLYCVLGSNLVEPCTGKLKKSNFYPTSILIEKALACVPLDVYDPVFEL